MNKGFLLATNNYFWLVSVDVFDQINLVQKNSRKGSDDSTSYDL